MEEMMKDIRDDLFDRIADSKVSACLYVDRDGIISGIANAVEEAMKIGLDVEYTVSEGDEVYAGDMILQVKGSPKQITMAEDYTIGCIAKTSGVATAAREFVKKADGRLRVVCGSWKKMPREMKDDLRKAAITGGVLGHITDEPMVYMDKNYVSMFGGIQNSLKAASQFSDRKKIIQVRGATEGGDVVREAWTAITSGADIVFVDTGKISDLAVVTKTLKPVLRNLEKNEDYRKVEFAFGGGILLGQLEELIEAGADVIDVGRSICDAPLLDMHLNVTNVEMPETDHHDYHLLHKNELTIEGIHLNGTNLTELANIVAEEIGVTSDDVLVIDVRDSKVALDVLREDLDPSKFVAKEERILGRISSLDGASLSKDARISSNGMLGWIVGGDQDLEESRLAIERSRAMASSIRKKIDERVLVFPTGAEVESGEIEDTNTPLIVKKFTEAGFTADRGEVLKDDIELFTGKLWRASERGYSVIITTGGVGAENKDFSVEAIERLDADAATPYIAKFVMGHGRHSKEGIRIGVGQMGITKYIALPGPNDEVALCIDTVVRGVKENWSKEILAGEIARILRKRLKEKVGVKDSMHEHSSDRTAHDSMWLHQAH